MTTGATMLERAIPIHCNIYSKLPLAPSHDGVYYLVFFSSWFSSAPKWLVTGSRLVHCMKNSEMLGAGSNNTLVIEYLPWNNRETSSPTSNIGAEPPCPPCLPSPLPLPLMVRWAEWHRNTDKVPIYSHRRRHLRDLLLGVVWSHPSSLSGNTKLTSSNYSR